MKADEARAVAVACEESVAGGDSAPAVAITIGSDRGLPVPGEAALIAAGLLAGSGRRTKTIFLGRWITCVRAVAAVMAGAANMPWGTFLLYNTLRAVAWAATIASAAALLGPVIVGVIYGAGVAAAGGGAILAGTRGWWRRRRVCARAAATVTAADPVATTTR